MNKAYVISTVTALALGYTAGFTSDNLTAKAAIERDHNTVVEYGVGTGAAQATWEGYLEGWLCGKVVDEFGIDAEDCDVELFKSRGVSVFWEIYEEEETPRWVVKSNVTIPGTWVAGEPE